jgi:hypothetical protein
MRGRFRGAARRPEILFFTAGPGSLLVSHKKIGLSAQHISRMEVPWKKKREIARRSDGQGIRVVVVVVVVVVMVVMVMVVPVLPVRRCRRWWWLLMPLLVSEAAADPHRAFPFSCSKLDRHSTRGNEREGEGTR